MCEILGISVKSKRDVKDYLNHFVPHSVQNPHGWGIFREQDGRYEISREVRRAKDSELLKDIICDIQEQSLMMCHIRFATIGSTSIVNCHPFTGTDLCGRTWTLIHNGTVYSGKKLTNYFGRQKGETDSERIFLYLMDEIEHAVRSKGNTLTQEERFAIVEKMAEDLAPRNKLNFMIYDEELLYVHNNMKETLHFRELDDGFLIATLPIDDKKWLPFPMTRVIAFQEGEVRFRGHDHGHVFVPNLEYINAMAAMNI